MALSFSVSLSLFLFNSLFLPLDLPFFYTVSFFSPLSCDTYICDPLETFFDINRIETKKKESLNCALESLPFFVCAFTTSVLQDKRLF